MDKLQVNIVLEILGRPKEHVKESLNTLVVKLGSEKGIKILNKEYHDPIPLENSKDLFTAFAELSLELESLDNYFGILFAYMPSNIELVYPEKISLTNIHFNDLGNRLVQRLHDYDAITKKALIEGEILKKKLQEIAPHLFQAPNSSQTKNNEKLSSKKSTKAKKKNKIRNNYKH